MNTYVMTQLHPDFNAAYKTLTTIPFEERDGVYVFSMEFAQDAAKAANLVDVLASTYGPDRAMRDTFHQALQQLSQLRIDPADLQLWVIQRKEVGGILTYHEILRDTYHSLVLNAFTQALDIGSDTGGIFELGESETYARSIKFDDEFIRVFDAQEDQETYHARECANKQQTVLNRNNPFADVSITDQKFIYAGEDNQFESVSLHTSHTLTRINQGDDDFLALQPGFKIKKSKDITHKTTSTILFDDTVSNEVARKDDTDYVYID